MLTLVGSEGAGATGGGGANKMEKEFDSKLRIQSSASNPSTQRSKSFAFRAPQENFSIQDFELGKIYGVGSYSKVPTFAPWFRLLFFFIDFWTFVL